MALGDYVKTTFVEGTAPGLSAIRLNNHESKTAELDAAAAANQTTVTAHLAENATYQEYLCFMGLRGIRRLV